MITRVFKRLRNVLVFIDRAKGKNDLVGKERGKKFYQLDLQIDLTDENAVPVPSFIYAPEEEEVGAEETI